MFNNLVPITFILIAKNSPNSVSRLSYPEGRKIKIITHLKLLLEHNAFIYNQSWAISNPMND